MSKITNLLTRDLHNAEFFQFIETVCALFLKYNIDAERLQPLYDGLVSLTKQMELSLIAEKRNEKIREKNEMDRRRDRLHSRLFNYLKYIMYDETDVRYDDAQVIMNVLKMEGNPTKLSENKQSAVMTSIGNRLQTLVDKLEAIGAKEMVDEMMNANNQFIILEREAVEITKEQKIENVPSATSVKKQADELYKTIVGAFNAYAKMPHKKEKYEEMIVELNVVIGKYSALIAARKRSR